MADNEAHHLSSILSVGSVTSILPLSTMACFADKNDASKTAIVEFVNQTVK